MCWAVPRTFTSGPFELVGARQRVRALASSATTTAATAAVASTHALLVIIIVVLMIGSHRTSFTDPRLKQVAALAVHSRTAFEVPARISFEAIKPVFSAPRSHRELSGVLSLRDPRERGRQQCWSSVSGHIVLQIYRDEHVLRRSCPDPSRDREKHPGEPRQRRTTSPRLAGSLRFKRGGSQRGRSAQRASPRPTIPLVLTYSVSTRKPSPFVSARQFWAGRFR